MYLYVSTSKIFHFIGGDSARPWFCSRRRLWWLRRGFCGWWRELGHVKEWYVQDDGFIHFAFAIRVADITGKFVSMQFEFFGREAKAVGDGCSVIIGIGKAHWAVKERI